MSDKTHSVEAQRDQSQEHKAATRLEQEAGANGFMAGVYRDFDSQNVGVGGGLVGHNSHLNGNVSSKTSGAVQDTARDKAVEEHSADSPDPITQSLIKGQASRNIDADYTNPQFDAATDLSKSEDQQHAIQRDTQSRDAGRGLEAAAVSASMGDTPKDLDQHTAKSAQEGILGSANPLTGDMGKGMGGGMGAALAQARESGVMGVLGKSGASMGGGQSLFGDGGKSMAAPSTPGQKEFTNAKQAEQGSMLPQRQ